MSSSPAAGPTRRALVALLACAALLVACAGPDEQGGRDEVTFLNFLPLDGLTFAPEMLAQAAGYFAEEGLDVRFEATQGSGPAIQTVLTGRALLTRIGDIETMVAVGERGAPLVTIGSAVKSSLFRIVSSDRRPITTAAGFEGALVGVASEGGGSEAMLDLIAGSADLPPDAVRRQVVGIAPGIFELVRNGRIDAYAVALDTAVQLERAEPAAVVYRASDDVSAGAQVFVTSADQARDPAKSDRMRRFLAAVERSMEFMVADADTGFTETMRLIDEEFDVTVLEEPEVARESLQAYVESFVADGGENLVANSPERWRTTYEELAGIGMVRPGLDPGAWNDPGFAPGA
ncbi:ABC transporter substrate-binding protein [Pseudonocardia sp. MH-G8]|uniref:ABC transporter substrate-binding protein n=1 Tax=Pseudonocardia sp. MH-G8 TaxID=1854588 RepID=UPI000B9FEAF6|nr:ABC transporter substrate-binding protein [Pseudonocardia sp. MH-G8]OZM81353.1 hypothetical protein CFP66_14395 [Pseudonocardia sp. MH-G8]